MASSPRYRRGFVFMAPRTLPKPPYDAQHTDSNGMVTPRWQRWYSDFSAIAIASQKATDATIIASAPPAVSTSGGVTIYRPTTSSGSGYSAPTAAYDGNPATPATAKITGVQTQQRTWSAFPALQGSASALALKVISSVAGVAAPPRHSDVVTTARGNQLVRDVDDPAEIATIDNGATATLEYSVDSGATWQPVYSVGNVSTPTVSIALPLSTSFPTVQVRATAEGAVAGAAITHNILEIWIEVTP